MHLPVDRVVASFILFMGVAVGDAMGESPSIAIETGKGKITFQIDGKAFADFVYEDQATTRPYLAHVKAPSGFQVTRNHPPKEGVDPLDHETLHPGIWMSFSELSGADFWRNKAPVKFEKFLDAPKANGDHATLTARFRYESNGKTIAREDLHLAVINAPEGRWILWDSVLSGDEPLIFSDQEEMGLGTRVATPLTVKEGGTITSSDGKKNEEEVRGTRAAWCEYSKEIDGVPTGLLIVPHPDNEPRVYWHARDYGMLTANPFGAKSLTGKGDGKVVIKPPQTMRLRFGILIFSASIDANEVARRYPGLARENGRGDQIESTSGTKVGGPRSSENK